jgi:subtilisin family serine protease
MTDQQELISRILDLHLPVVIMPINCEESDDSDESNEQEQVEEQMLDQPGSHTNERYIIAYNSNIDSNDKTDKLNQIPGFKSKHKMSHALHGCTATINKNLLPQLMDDPEILYIEKDAVMYEMSYTKQPFDEDLIKNIEAYQALWHQTITNTTLTSTDDYSTIHCYVLDTGILNTHSEFSTGQVTLSYNPMTKNTAAKDDNGHGTAVASIIGGKSIGIANRTRLYSIKVLDATGSGYTSDIISGLNWVISNKKSPCVINMSLGGSFSSSLNTAVQNCINNGITVVCASGNEGIDAVNSSPANVAGAITVSAYDQNKTRPSWSNYGSVVDTFGPGSMVKAAWGDNTTSYFLVSGTSFAAPIITGIICRYLKLNPSAKPSDIAAFLFRANLANEIINPGENTSNLRLIWNPTKINPC